MATKKTEIDLRIMHKDLQITNQTIFKRAAISAETSIKTQKPTHRISILVPLQILNPLTLIRHISNDVDVQTTHLSTVHAIPEL